MNVPRSTRGWLAILAVATACGPSLAQVSWLQARNPFWHGSIAYDEGRARTVLVSGDMTWEWDGTWTFRTRSGPSARALCFDAHRQCTVLLGGSSGNETWEWDGRAWSPRLSANSPPVRDGAGFAYDRVRQRAVLFGGFAPNLSGLGDTWEWDGSNWVQRATSGPSARGGAAMAYDSARQSTVLFGGAASPSNAPLGDTWTWNGSTWQSITAPGPSARVSAAMAYDAQRQLCVLQGGETFGFPATTVHADTWEWNGTAWSPRAVTMAVKARHSMSYDTARGLALAYGGGPGFPSANLYAFNGAQWAQLSPSADPGPDRYHAMATDLLRGRVVMFGTDRLVHEWDGTMWNAVQTLLSPPGFRTDAGMEFDLLRGKTVLFGGLFGVALNDTWTWDGSAWQQQMPSASPPSRSFVAMARHTPTGEIVLFSGGANTAAADTWTWNGTTWTQRTPTTSPPGRTLHAMASDEARGVVVLYGGMGANFQQDTDTWTWDGANWTRHVTANYPSNRLGHAMAYDYTRQRVVLAGGASNPLGNQIDAWDWDGTNWSLTSGTFPGQGLYGHKLAYDQVHGALLHFGGIGYSGQTADTWWLGNVSAASATATGTGCGGGPPRIATSAPGFSSDLVLDLLGAPAAAPGFLALGFPRVSPLALGGGCTFYLDAPVTSWLVTTNASGFATAHTALPAAPWLRGVTIAAQACVVDPNGAFAGLSLTGMVSLRIGD